MARIELVRDIILVARHDEGWAVQHSGEVSGACRTKEEAKAAANKLARASQDAGRPCQVRVSGEDGYFAVI